MMSKNFCICEVQILHIITLLHVYASLAVHSDCDVGLERAKITGFCMHQLFTSVLALFKDRF